MEVLRLLPAICATHLFLLKKPRCEEQQRYVTTLQGPLSYRSPITDAPFSIFILESHHEWQRPHVHVLFRHSQAECCFFRRGLTWKIFPTWNGLPQSRPAYHHGHFSEGQSHASSLWSQSYRKHFCWFMVVINSCLGYKMSLIFFFLTQD